MKRLILCFLTVAAVLSAFLCGCSSDGDGASREHWELLADKQEQCFRQALLLKSLEEHRKQLVPGKACPLCGSEEHPFACGNIPEPEKENKELQKIKTRIAGIGKTEQLLHKNTAELELCRNNISRLQEKQKQLSEQLFSKTADAGEYCRKAQEISAEIALAEEKIAETFSAFGMIYDKENHKLPEELSFRSGNTQNIRRPGMSLKVSGLRYRILC